MTETLLLPARHKLDADAYFRMAELGILERHDRVELIDGEIIDMMPIGMEHAATVNGLTRALVMACGEKAIVSVQNPVQLNVRNVPEPDFAIFKARADFYAREPAPAPADVLLLVEVADSSLRYDRSVKMPLYAKTGIPEFWLVDVAARRLEAHRQPGPDGYADITTHGPGEHLALAAAPDIVVRLDLMFA